MLEIIIPKTEYFDETKNEFLYSPEYLLCLEHSLVSLSLWESKWKLPFLSQNEKTPIQQLDYIRCMNLTQGIPEIAFNGLTERDIRTIAQYMEDPMTATTIAQDKRKPANREIVTAEIIYYWMIAHSIPFECQYWHLRRLMTLIDICNIKNSPSKKMSKHEIMAQNRQLNESRRKALNTRG